MLKNNNQIAVKRISIRSLHQNRVRNIITILAIVLTTFMFTSVFSIGFSLAKNMATMITREQGSKATIFLNHPTKQQKEEAEKIKGIHAVGIRMNVNTALLEDTEKEINLDYYDTVEFEKNYVPAIGDIHGNYPKEDDEVMLSIGALDQLKIKKPKQGMEVSLNVDGWEQKFRLSGWFREYAYNSVGYQGFVSLAYARQQGLNEEKNGILSISAKMGKQKNVVEELEDTLKLQNGQKFDYTVDMQDENGSDTLVIVIAIAILGAIILFSGYLLIYNVMYISVAKDIRFYGMLKTIGTSPKQIMAIVKRQGNRLALIGIPIGMVLGTATSFGIVPLAMKTFTDPSGVMPTEVRFHPIIYIATILFALLTIKISCRKPARTAGKVSPIEALKYNGLHQEKIRHKKTTNGGKLYKMAWRNVFREKKRAIIVFASLFIGTITFLAANTFLGSLKLENYVDYYLPNDYVIYTSNEETEDTDTYRNITEKMVEELKNIDGITSVYVTKSADAYLQFDESVYKPFLENGSAEFGQSYEELVAQYQQITQAYSAPIVSVSSDVMKEYNKYTKHKIDIERFDKGEICLVGFVENEEQSKSVTGKNITIINNETGKTMSIEVGACPLQSEDKGLEIGYYWMMGGAPSCVIMSEKAMVKLSEKTLIDNVVARCEENAEPVVTGKVKALVEANPAVIHTEIKSESIKSFQSAMTGMNILSGGISMILILIGILNFINVMLTGVFTRQKELAVMESVGMTKRQVYKMLMFEGVYYAVIVVALILTVGNGIVYGMAEMTMQIADYAVFYYPLKTIMMMAAAILLICIVVPVCVYRTISDKSITERISIGE